jgi:hypothetical protein
MLLMWFDTIARRPLAAGWAFAILAAAEIASHQVSKDAVKLSQKRGTISSRPA